MIRGIGLLLLGLVVLGCRRQQESPPAAEARPKAAAASPQVSTDITPHLAALAGNDQDLAGDAQEALVELGPGVVPALVAALPHQPTAARVRIVRALARIRSDAAVAAVTEVASKDGDLEVRAASLRALAPLGDARSRDVVVAALDDPLPAVRWAALAACATRCTTPEAFDKIAVLAVNDPDLTAGLMARATLADLRAGGHAEPVRAAVARKALPALSGGAPDTRVRAALLAADGGDAGALASLAALATGVPPALQRQVAFVLGSAGDSRAVEPLKALLAQQDAGVQLYAYDALRRLGERGVSGAQEAAASYAGPKPWAALEPPDA
jgi:HEAT repeat protein